MQTRDFAQGIILHNSNQQEKLSEPERVDERHVCPE
jgi:hypothetical protein